MMCSPFSHLIPTVSDHSSLIGTFSFSFKTQQAAPTHPMTPFYLQPPSPLPHLGSNEETSVVQPAPNIQNQSQLLLFDPLTKSPFQYPIFFGTNQDEEEQEDDYDDDHEDDYNYHAEERVVEQQFSRDGSTAQFLPSSSDLHLNNSKRTISIRANEDEDRVPGPVKSNPLKESILNSDQTILTKPLRKRLPCHYPQPSPLNNNNSSNNSGRVCSDCNTTKTPLWRSGPRGPKSLCNACGIRHRKARRAMAAAAANKGLDRDVSTKKKTKTDKRLEPDFTNYYKRPCEMATPPTRKKLCFEMDLDFETEDDGLNLHYTPSSNTLDYSVGLRKSSSFHRVFPEDEEQGAILLMALSCGFIRSR